MGRKITDGPIRNRERTMNKLLEAVGEIIRTEGHTKLGVNHVARTAGVSKKLIYRYFGSLNELIEMYIRTKDFWVGKRASVDELVERNHADKGRHLAHSLLSEFVDYLEHSPETQKAVLWEISQRNKPMRVVSAMREEIGEELFGLTDPAFERTGVDLRAIVAILTGGLYYLTLRAHSCGGTFCGIDVGTDKGKERITDAVDRIVDWSFDRAEKNPISRNMSPPV